MEQKTFYNFLDISSYKWWFIVILIGFLSIFIVLFFKDKGLMYIYQNIKMLIQKNEGCKKWEAFIALLIRTLILAVLVLVMGRVGFAFIEVIRREKMLKNNSCESVCGTIEVINYYESFVHRGYSSEDEGYAIAFKVNGVYFKDGIVYPKEILSYIEKKQTFVVLYYQEKQENVILKVSLLGEE